MFQNAQLSNDLTYFFYQSGYSHAAPFKMGISGLFPCVQDTSHLKCIRSVSVRSNLPCINPLPPSNAVQKQKKNILEDLFSLVSSKFKKYHPPGNLKFNFLGIFQSLRLRISMEKIFLISLRLNFTPNTSGCYGLTYTRAKRTDPFFSNIYYINTKKKASKTSSHP